MLFSDVLCTNCLDRFHSAVFFVEHVETVHEIAVETSDLFDSVLSWTFDQLLDDIQIRGVYVRPSNWVRFLDLKSWFISVDRLGRINESREISRYVVDMAADSEV